MTNLIKRLCFCFTISVSSLAFSANPLSQPLSQQLSVAGQMTTDKFEQLLKQGFKSVIVNRPDQEAGNLVTANQLRNIAEKSHVSLIYQPVVSGHISPQDIVEFAKYYNNLPKPVLMVCKSGNRSATLYQKAREQGLLHE